MAEEDNGKLVHSNGSLVYDPDRGNRLVFYWTPPEEEPDPDPIDDQPPEDSDPPDDDAEDYPDSEWSDIGVTLPANRSKSGSELKYADSSGPMPNAEPGAWGEFLSSEGGSTYSVIQRERRKREEGFYLDHRDYVDYNACAWGSYTFRPRDAEDNWIDRYWRITQIKIQVESLYVTGWGSEYRPTCWVHYSTYTSRIPSYSWSYWTSPPKANLPLQDGIYIFGINNVIVGDLNHVFFHSVGFFSPNRANSWEPVAGGGDEEKLIRAQIHVVGALWSI